MLFFFFWGGRRWLSFNHPRGTWWGCCGLCFSQKLTELAHSFLFSSCVSFRLYGPFNCISFHKFYRELSDLSLCSSGVISAPMVLSTTCIFMKVSFSPDVIPSGWLGSKYQLSNSCCCSFSCWCCFLSCCSYSSNATVVVKCTAAENDYAAAR